MSYPIHELCRRTELMFVRLLIVPFSSVSDFHYVLYCETGQMFAGAGKSDHKQQM